MNSPLQIAKQYFAFSNKSDFGGIADLLSETTTYSSPATGIYLGSSDIMAMQRAFHGKFSSLNWQVNSVKELKPGVVLFSFDFMGVMPNGEKVKSSGLEYVIIREGKIQHIEIRNVTPASKAIIVNADECPVEDWSKEGRSDVSWRTLISADRTPTNSITMGVAEIKPGNPKEFHLHRHEPAEAYYILAGKGTVSIDGVENPVQEGSAIFVPSNSMHALSNTGEGVLRLMYIFAIDSFADVKYIFPN